MKPLLCQLTWPVIVSSLPPSLPTQILLILPDPSDIFPVHQASAAIPATGDALPLCARVSLTNTEPAFYFFVLAAHFPSLPLSSLSVGFLGYVLLNPLPINMMDLFVYQQIFSGQSMHMRLIDSKVLGTGLCCRGVKRESELLPSRGFRPSWTGQM